MSFELIIAMLVMCMYMYCKAYNLKSCNLPETSVVGKKLSHPVVRYMYVF